jgi:hypothetical protein
MALEQQVFSPTQVDFGKTAMLIWVGWNGDTSKVPRNKILDITTLTFSYFPSQGGTVGRVHIGGRESTGNSAWLLQAIYVEPKKTVHLVFPKGLRLKAGGSVEIEFLDDGPGTILVEAHGMLLPA